ncbi:MAG: hypothetical protein WED09_08520 [Homoserinimonas sp.]
MNSTNRFANRLLLLLVGLTALLLGAAAVGLATSATLIKGWNQIAPGILATIETFLQATPAEQSAPNWLLAGAAAVAVLVLGIVVLAIFIFRQGRGQTNRVIAREVGNGGTTIIDTAVTADILNEMLSQHPEVIASHVSAYEVRRTPVLDIWVTCRRGASPRAVGDIIENSLNDLESLVGTEIPALIGIRGGSRARFS